MALFGFGSNQRANKDALDQIRRDFADLLIHPTPEDCARAFESWAWVRPPKADPVLVSAFGDAFFDTRSGVLMLDTLEGALNRVARNMVELREKLAAVEQQDKLLSSVWVQAARRAGLELGAEEAFDWKVAPRIGGAISIENIGKLSFVVKVNIAGQLHDQVRKLPPGTRINRVSIG